MKYLFFLFVFFSYLNVFSNSILSSNFKFIQNKLAKIDHPDSIVFNATKAFEIGVLNNNPSEKTLALLLISRAYISLAEYTKAEIALKRASYWSKISKNKNLEGLVILELGKNYQLTNAPDKALYLMLKAKRIFESKKYEESIIRATVYLAEYYRSLQNFTDGEKYINIALRKSKKVKIENKLRILLNNRAAALKTETRNHNASFRFSKIAIDLSEKCGLFHEKATSLNEVGFNYENLHQFDKALLNYSEARELWYASRQLRNWVLVTENIARTYRKMGEYEKSNQLAFEAERIAKEHKWYSNLLSIYILIGGNYDLLNDVYMAMNYDKYAMEIELLLYKERNLREIKEIKAKYESEKKEELLKEKNKEIKRSQEKIKEQKKDQKNLYIGIFGLLILLVVVIYLASNRMYILNQLRIKTKELELSNQSLNLSLNKSEVLLQEVHHRVKNNLQFITSIIELEIDSNSSSTKKDSLIDISRRISAMSLVHELLYNYDNIEKIAAKKYIHDLVISIDEMINRQHLPIKFEIEIEDVLFEVKQCIAVGMIISELVSNSIKHAFKSQENPIIFIQLQKNETLQTITLTVKDNGSGITKEKINKKGLGSRLVHIFTVQLGGHYTIDSTNQFLFQFEFPLEEC